MGLVQDLGKIESHLVHSEDLTVSIEIPPHPWATLHGDTDTCVPPRVEVICQPTPTPTRAPRAPPFASDARQCEPSAAVEPRELAVQYAKGLRNSTSTLMVRAPQAVASLLRRPSKGVWPRCAWPLSLKLVAQPVRRLRMQAEKLPAKLHVILLERSLSNFSAVLARMLQEF